MKIVFSTDQIYLHGGLEKVMAQKANYFVEVFNYEVTILTTEQKNNVPCYALNDKIKFVDLAVNYERQKSFFHPKNLKKIPFHFKQWNKAILDINPDIIIVCNQSFDFYWAPFFKTKVKKIREFHATAFNLFNARKVAGFSKRIQLKISDFVASKYDVLLLLNKDEKQFYKSQNTVVIPNPLISNNKKASLTNHKVIAAGRIAYVKGFEFLIESWKLVVDKYPDWELHIYGQGEENYIQELNNLIKSYYLHKNVYIKPATDNLLDVMQEYSLFVMSSRNECFPMVLLESLSIGLPIVSFDCPTGPRNIITQESDGFLVEMENCEQLSEKIVFLIQNEAQRKIMGANAKQNSARFNEESVMQQWKSMLINLTK
ncbi:glycosyltransferase family 4 protein [Flavobacterium sp. SUN052]|uniref:glycosyltransferase family 4 protein n=1 Tax=Flavobacterium sp. SUN052 TaxID=3002441 RepID=UPI00237E3D8B|nr:glycosyltransferase family 4 protein [Flavobacterium sp. SUN052]MEC4004419.1 glycosyltransferase family 4 protein [Flavobacterium sp. SUN052]